MSFPARTEIVVAGARQGVMASGARTARAVLRSLRASDRPTDSPSGHPARGAA